MTDRCLESSLEGSDSILSDSFSIYSESSTSNEDEHNEEASASYSSVRNRFRLRNRLRKGKDKAIWERSRRRSNGGIDIVLWCSPSPNDKA